MTRPPVHGRARLVLQINGVEYALRPLGSADAPPAAWRMVKLSDDGVAQVHYEVHLTDHGPQCNCPDFIYARRKDPKGCKHVAALRAIGLFPKEAAV